MNIATKNKLAGKVAAVATALLAALSFSACHDANAGQESSDQSITNPRPDTALQKLMQSLSDNDAPGFAALCVYPIQRPYPLKDIEDSVSMVDYYPILVDQGLRDSMKKLTLDDWEVYGWRGWSFGEDTPFWVDDDGIEIIDYVSPAENGLQKILAREEIMTLAPRYREGWTPVMTLIQIEGDTIFRIDSDSERLRLMQYSSPREVFGTPDLELYGSMRTEGSADTRIYEFSGSDGTEAEYLPDAETPFILTVRKHKGKGKVYEVRPGYWRDIVGR